jgi:hypothetical protein
MVMADRIHPCFYVVILFQVQPHLNSGTGSQRLQLSAPKGENVSLLVAVRVRPVLRSEQSKSKDAQPKKDILRVIDKRMVLVMDPEDPEEKDYLDQVQNRSKVGIWEAESC